MSYRKLVTSIAALSLFAPLSLAQQTTQSPPPLGTASFTPPESKQQEPLTPENFVVRAAIRNLAEIAAAEMALEKSGDAALRKLAMELLNDHRAAQAQLKAVAADAKIALPGTVDIETREQQQALGELVGSDFDRGFLDHLQSDHAESLELFQQASQANLPPAFKRYAENTAKTVNAHRARISELRTRAQR